MTQDNPFHWETGLPDNFEAVITGAIFRHDPDYMNGVPAILTLTLQSNDLGVGEQVRKIGVGKGWEVADGGARVVREDGRDINFHESSGVAMLCNAMVTAGGTDELVERLKSGLSPQHAQFFVGMGFRWNQVKHDYGGEIGEKTLLLPTAYLGATLPAATVAKAPPTPATPIVTTAKKAPSVKSVGETVTGVAGEIQLDTATYEVLFKMAYHAPDHDSFVEEAIAQYGAGNVAVSQAVQEGADVNSIWGRAVTQYQQDQQQ